MHLRSTVLELATLGLKLTWGRPRASDDCPVLSVPISLQRFRAMAENSEVESTAAVAEAAAEQGQLTMFQAYKSCTNFLYPWVKAGSPERKDVKFCRDPKWHLKA